MASGQGAIIRWQRDGDFATGRYSRSHEWVFDGGLTVPASSSPAVVKPPLAREDAIDPEEALVAAIASCHMLWFLDLARRRGHVVETYEDAPEGRMGRLEQGRYWVERVTLRPRITFAGEPPSQGEIDALHEEAHQLCFIANSVRSEVVIEPVS